MPERKQQRYENRLIYMYIYFARVWVEILTLRTTDFRCWEIDRPSCGAQQQSPRPIQSTALSDCTRVASWPRPQHWLGPDPNNIACSPAPVRRTRVVGNVKHEINCRTVVCPKHNIYFKETLIMCALPVHCRCQTCTIAWLDYWSQRLIFAVQ